MDRLITININGVHKDELKELRDYLEDNCWSWTEEDPFTHNQITRGDDE